MRANTCGNNAASILLRKLCDLPNNNRKKSNKMLKGKSNNNKKKKTGSKILYQIPKYNVMQIVIRVIPVNGFPYLAANSLNSITYFQFRCSYIIL